MTESSVSVPRQIAKKIYALEEPEGDGARVRRSIGNGFPDHPHRGQETITYVLKGTVDHEDFTGSKGTIGPGELQFMTAGRGIVHAEIPRKDDHGNDPEIIQLWVDLPRELKGCKPRYRNLKAKQIPTVNPSDKVEIKIISGQSHGVESVQNLAYTPVVYYDCKVQPGGAVVQKVPQEFNVFLHVLSGVVTVNSKPVKKHHTILFGDSGDAIEVSVHEKSKEDARFIIAGGKRLDQQVFQEGPFVAVSREGVKKALSDYQSGKHGFEKSKGWKSKIAHP